MSALTEFKQKLMTLYQSKTESEQRLILLLVVFILLFTLFKTYSTVANGLEQTSAKLAKQQELNVWANQQIQLIKGAGNTTSATSSGSMTQIINSTARQNGITLARLQPQTTDAVKVGLEDINFNQLMVWLSTLNEQHGVRVANIDISKSDVAGIVKVRRLDLERN